MAGRGRVVAVAIELSEAERRELECLANRRKTAQGLARRARIMLAAAEGLQNKQIVERLGIDANTVSKWRRRFAARRRDWLHDEPRPGAPRRIGDDAIAETIRKTLEETPPGATTGRSEAWPGRRATRRPRSTASGRPSHSSRIAAIPSSCRPTLSSSRRSATLSGSIWRRPIGRWCCAWTKSARSRRSTARSRSCRCVLASPSGAPTITSVTARPRSSPRSTSPRAR